MKFKCRIEIEEEFEAKDEDEAREAMEDSIKFCVNWQPKDIEVNETRSFSALRTGRLVK